MPPAKDVTELPRLVSDVDISIWRKPNGAYNWIIHASHEERGGFDATSGDLTSEDAAVDELRKIIEALLSGNVTTIIESNGETRDLTIPILQSSKDTPTNT